MVGDETATMTGADTTTGVGGTAHTIAMTTGVGGIVLTIAIVATEPPAIRFCGGLRMRGCL